MKQLYCFCHGKPHNIVEAPLNTVYETHGSALYGVCSRLVGVIALRKIRLDLLVIERAKRHAGTRAVGAGKLLILADQRYAGVDLMRSSGKKANHASGVIATGRLAQNLFVHNHRGVASQNEAAGAMRRNGARFCQCQARN